MQSIIYDILYYIYVLFFGVYVSLKIACGTVAGREWRLFAVISPALLIFQGIFLQLCGFDMVWMLYPCIVHLPITLALILFLKVKWDTALVSVVISYSMCQVLRWIGLVIDTLVFIPIVSFILHLSLCQLLLLLLNQFCLKAIHNVIDRSAYLRKWFGALPTIYYLYEYFVIYTQQRFAHFLAFDELLPTGMVLFFIMFVIAYQREMEKRELAEQQTIALETELSRATHEIAILRVIEEQTAIHRHDLRHHLMMIDSLLAVDKSEQAAVYIRNAVNEIEAIAPVRYCDNETINLLLSAFQAKAESKGASMSVKTTLPRMQNMADTELCAILSNGLENALNAVSCLPENEARWIDVFCGEKQNNLLTEIKNPYTGEIKIQNGIPIPKSNERRYGCRSILSIVHRRKGVCTFDAAKSVFVLRIAIPIEKISMK